MKSTWNRQITGLIAGCLCLSYNRVEGVIPSPRRDVKTTTAGLALPNVTASGYLEVDPDANSTMFYSYYEAQEAAQPPETPILLWLQVRKTDPMGGPGCASMFGNLYELGPYLVNDSLGLQPNPGAWNRIFGLLFIDQPIGTGFSRKGARSIPGDETAVATDLYVALQAFFTQHQQLQTRPLFITGESYAGKYVPAIGHFILQAQAKASQGSVSSAVSKRKPFPDRALQAGAPLFDLRGLAIGNGLTDPVPQVLAAADTAYYMGLIDTQQRVLALGQQLQIAQLAQAERWDEAHRARNALLGFLTRSSGVGTLFDVRRNSPYDPNDNVGRYLNQPAVQEALGTLGGGPFISCSDEVDRALGPDVMKSAKDLLPDILDQLPLLLYQGLFDAQDGPATIEAWLPSLDWWGQNMFSKAHRKLWRPNFETASSSATLLDELWEPEQEASGDSYLSHPGESSQQTDGSIRASKNPVAGYWKSAGPLTQVVLRGTGHMVPHDVGRASQAMIERWVLSVVNHQAMHAKISRKK